MPPIPRRLKKEPLLEAIWELRFTSGHQVPVGDILPGLIYQALRADYPEFTRLPAADIPAAISANDSNVAYLVHFRLEREESPFIIQIGPQVVSLNCRRPYAGWARFKERILVLVKVLEETALIQKPERHALRYLDLLQLDAPPSTESLQIELNLGVKPVIHAPLQLRTELHENGIIHVVQIATPAQVQLGKEHSETGTLVDLDTALKSPSMLFDNIESELEQLHDASKRKFFALLTKEAIERLEPEY